MFSSDTSAGLSSNQFLRIAVLCKRRPQIKARLQTAADHYPLLDVYFLPAHGTDNLKEATDGVLYEPDAAPGELETIVRRYAPLPVLVLLDKKYQSPGIRIFSAGAADYLYYDELDSQTLYRTMRKARQRAAAQSAGLQHDIGQLPSTEAELHKRNAYLEALHETALGLMNRLELPDLLDSLVKRASIFADSEYGYVYLVDEKNRQLRLVASTEESLVGLTLPYGQGAAGRIWQTGQPLFIDDYEAWEHKLTKNRADNLLAVGGIPLISDNKVIGVIGLANKKHGSVFSADDVEQLGHFARLAVIALDNSRLYQQSKIDLIRTRALYKITQAILTSDNLEKLLSEIIENTRDVFSARWGIIYKIDFDNERIEHVAVTSIDRTPLEPLNFEQIRDGLTGWAIGHRQPVLSKKSYSDPREHPQVRDINNQRGLGEAIVAPLIADDKPLGMMALINGVNDSEFREDDLEVIAAIASQAALAIAQHQLKQQIEHQAFHDALTGLPNRRLFENRLQFILAQAKRHHTVFAILVIDLDSFKHINDTLGHHTGDALLVAVTERLHRYTRKSDILARMGGDEFALIVDNLRYSDDAVRVAKSYLNLFQPAFVVAQHSLFIGASIGVSLYPEDGADAASLLQHADSAMYQAKAQGKNNVHSFTHTLSCQARERMELERDLRQALERNELALYYQPQIDLRSDRRIGVEALLRWFHPLRGLIEPLQSIPIAEDSRLIIPIGSWIIREACQQNAAWQQAGHEPVRVTVNVSALQFRQTDFCDQIHHELDHSGLAPQYLALEVAEHVVMQDVDLAIRHLRTLRDNGIEIVIDNFGTGYSSLRYLPQLPLDGLKIDRSFIAAIDPDGPNAVIETIVSLAAGLQLQAIAEGVETRVQLDYLCALGCHIAQGHYFAAPQPAAEIWQSEAV